MHAYKAGGRLCLKSKVQDSRWDLVISPLLSQHYEGKKYNVDYSLKLSMEIYKSSIPNLVSEVLLP